VGENRQEFGTKFGYDDENRPTSLTYSASGKEIGQSTTTIDKLNRTTFSAVSWAARRSRANTTSRRAATARAA